MKKTKFILSLFTALLFCYQAEAQCYASVTDPATGEMTYYRIYSAKNEYQNKCIQDNNYGVNNQKYKFLVEDCATDNKNQFFKFIPDTSDGDTTKYFIQNALSSRYIINKTQQIYKYFVYLNGYKSDATSFNVTHITKDQVLISATDEYGTARYLCASDSALNSPESLVMSETEGSSFAWHIAKVTNDPSAIISSQMDNNDISISVLNGQIVVAGTEDYNIYDLCGRKLPATGHRSHGIYIVHAGAKSFKVSVR